MIFNRVELEWIAGWTKTAKALTGIYYRSVEYRYMDPKEVLSGRGAAHYGGRFASVGTRAVYLAESDGGASGEVLARKHRLGGNAQITLDKYPRIVFGVSVWLERVLDFTKRGLPKQLMPVRGRCVAPDDLTSSMELGDLLRSRSIQGLVFRSAVGRGKNLIVYLEHCPAGALEIHNAPELMKKMREISSHRVADSLGCVNLLPLRNEIDTLCSAVADTNEAQPGYP